MKLMVMPVGRSLVFSGSQAKNISYPTDHRQKIFRTLPQMAWGGEFFSSDIMWWLGDWTRLIPAPAPIASKEPEKGKRYFGLYLLVGGRKPYTIWNPIYCKDSWRDYPLP